LSLSISTTSSSPSGETIWKVWHGSERKRPFLSPLGGFSVAIALAHRARRLGLRIVWSSLIDGAISRQAALHLAAGLADPREEEDELEREGEIHGLATRSLLAMDFRGAPQIEDGTIRLTRAAGLGLDQAPRSRDAFDGDEAFWEGTARYLGSAG
jgi:L-alanine-DL-glutamate epimerase-like enolase superfamily enzyme